MNWNLVLLIPPLAFLLLLLVSMGLSWLASRFAARGRDYAGKDKAYACGQNVDVNRVQPDYSEFFPIAFFFTIMHVAALIIGTAPAQQWLVSVLYLAVALLALRVLFRRDENVSH